MSDARWMRLVPELTVTELDRSLRFYCELLDFEIRFRRQEHKFAYLDLNGAQLMLEEAEDGWRTGRLEHPFGRGINLQIEIEDARGLAERLSANGLSFFRAPAENWYRADHIEHGQLEFLIQDPDGYLLRFCESLGERPATSSS